KSPARLAWEREWDCKKQMRDWIIENALASDEELSEIEREAKLYVKQCRNRAWEKYINPIKAQVNEAVSRLQKFNTIAKNKEIETLITDLRTNREPLRRDVMKALAT